MVIVIEVKTTAVIIGTVKLFTNNVKSNKNTTFAIAVSVVIVIILSNNESENSVGHLVLPKNFTQ